MPEGSGRVTECSMSSEFTKLYSVESHCCASLADDERSISKENVCNQSIVMWVASVLLSASAGFLFPYVNPLLHLGNGKIVSMLLIGVLITVAHGIRKFVCRPVAWQTFLACVLTVFASCEFVRLSSNAMNCFRVLVLSCLARVS